MAFVGDVVKKGFGVVGDLIFGGKKPAAPAPTPIVPPVPTRNAAAEAARRNDLLARRRGAAANEYAGAAPPATPAVKTLLGQ